MSYDRIDYKKTRQDKTGVCNTVVASYIVLRTECVVLCSLRTSISRVAAARQLGKVYYT